VAKEENPKLGLTLGILLGLLLVGGLAATPFYLPMLQQPERNLKAAVAQDVHELTRIVAGLDAELSAINDIRSSHGAAKDPTGEKTDEWQQNNRKFFDETVPILSPIATLVRQVVESDEKRDTANLTMKQETGRPNARNSMADMANKHAKQAETLMRQAQPIMQRVMAVTVGEASAGSDLEVTRVKALLHHTYGKILLNRAEFETLQCIHLRDEVADRLAVAGDLRRQREGLLAAAETQSGAALASSIAALEQQAAGLDRMIGKVAGQVEEFESRLSEVEPQLAEVEGRLAAAIAAKAAESTLLRLSAEARKLESESALLRNGALVGAKRIDPPPNKPGPPTYAGGTPQPGLRDMNAQLAQLKELRAGIGKQIDGFKATGQRIEQSAQQLQEEAKQIASRADKIESDAKKLSTAIPKHNDVATAASRDAIKSFEDASRAVVSAIRAANARTRNAATAVSEAGEKPDERDQRIAGDYDTEASLHCLAAEIAYHIGLTHALTLLSNESAADEADAGKNRGSQPAQEKSIRQAALAATEDALKAYDQASKLISRTNVRLASGPVSGKNYLWEVQVGEAGVHLLQAYVKGPPGADKDARKKAYAKLVEAVKGREQSPLLTPAADALVHLQTHPD
jgi:phage shock protein A